MNVKILLRIASGLLIFHLIAHTLGHSGWKRAEEPLKQEIINKMIGHKFPFMGAERSMGDYYEGYGYASTVALAFMAVVLWLISGAINTNKELSYRILLSLSLALLFWGGIEALYFFPFAASITLLACLLTLISAVQLRGNK
ncbi:hypothetical protein MYP_1603 [Sporocytophaga myxococcoides]|uniref:DoxX family protein n=1 Tax=Sporocytophaga myxococcoides TaxID=153721 RepID=A0A098LBS3_9BACT|nr:hypothetical protein [Sporocytophaga myxococcoides]GAL84375.1 hypothetical protein MYP_1603 [Sporocytophaga myxococcoides]